MDLHELDDRIDRLSIRKQLELLVRNLTDAKRKIEISNLFWHRVVAAEELLNAQEQELLDSAADALIAIRHSVGCRRRKRNGN